MKNSALTFWVFVLFVAAIAYAALYTIKHQDNSADPYTSAAAPSGASMTGTVKPFALTDQDGNEFDTKNLDGQVWVASFFFSSCPQVCLQMNQKLAKVQEDKRFADVKFVSITCDPDNDKPSILKQYGQKFAADDQRWKFLTGDQETITQVGLGLGITVKKITHSDRIILVDRNGEIRGAFITSDNDQWEFSQRALLKLVAEPIKPLVEPSKPVNEPSKPE